MSTGARELVLFIENDGELYRQQFQPIQKNLITKKARGIYVHSKAVKLFGYLTERGAKKYAKEYATPSEWNRMFTVADRKEAAEDLTNSFESQAENGEFDYLLPKKYQKNPGSIIPSTSSEGWIPTHAIRKNANGDIEILIERGTLNNPGKRKSVVSRIKKLFSSAGKAGKRVGRAVGLRNGRDSKDTAHDYIDRAFEAGKSWGMYGAADSGVANARVRHYGFIRYWNSLPPYVKPKSKLEKAFYEGYKIGKR